ncbi:1-deoxy-D-xylulose-5-phosphate reductoisomerase [Candidatus Pelagibacter sp.]|nr:1-deoxy-D-xylulose-5-phosphate reductoisomerase [Candidatus Pelagibacter sp.]
MKKIIILGSTGSIGKQTLEIVKKNRNNFKIVLLSTDKNINLISKQIKTFKVKNIVVTNKKKYEIIKKKFKKVKIFPNFKKMDKELKVKADYAMSAISGIEGLRPTINIIKKTKRIAIANKESLICGWDLIQKELKKNKTEFIPVDSEHFSIWSVIRNYQKSDIEKIILTASGGPFLNKKIKKNITTKDAIKHPNWAMGKKISIDSATMMNKIFEVIEAKKIFNIELNKFEILIHPKSYIHAIVKLKNGLIKIVAHDTDMKIPISNSIYMGNENQNFVKSKKINLEILNSLDFQKVRNKKFPIVKILKKITKKESLFDTVLVSMNDELVSLFLKNKINFLDISSKICLLMNSPIFSKFKHQKVKNLAQIEKLNEFVRLKTRTLSVISQKK